LVVTMVFWSFAAGWAFQRYWGPGGGTIGQYAALAQAGESRAGGDLLGQSDGSGLEPLGLFWEVLNHVRHAYYKPVTDEDEKALAFGAAQGLTRALGDPYSDFMVPQVAQEFSADTEGVMEGIGAELINQVDDGSGQRRVVIHKPLKGSPAAKAGLLPEDQIVFVDDVSVIDRSVDEVAVKIRGERGTSVKITVYRKGSDDLLDFTITRQRIELPVVEYRQVTDGIWLLAIDEFNDLTVSKTLEALDDIDRQGRKGLIIDLRDNKGGVLDFCVDISSVFIKEQPIVWVEERDGGQKSMQANPKIYRGDPGPMVVLVNGRTASAAEIVAGALQDCGVAKLVGTRTFGKGLVQTVIPLHDPSVKLKLTTAKWLTPKKRFINRELSTVLKRAVPGTTPEVDESKRGGLAPDVEAKITPEDDEKRVLEQLPEDKDPQLQAAISLLTNPEA